MNGSVKGCESARGSACEDKCSPERSQYVSFAIL
jgi:hypothetical protein